jgi:hypothetical protein
MHYLGYTTGVAPPQEGVESMQVKEPGENNAPVQQEGAGDNEESVLDNLRPLSGDESSIDSEEYNRLTKEMEDKEKAEVKSAPPKEVLATVAGLDEDTDSEKTPPDARISGPSDPRAPHRVRTRATRELRQGRGLDFGEVMTMAELTRLAGQNGNDTARPEILTKPITAEEAADPGALEAKRKELLAKAEKITKTAATMLAERAEVEELIEVVEDQEHRTT